MSTPQNNHPAGHDPQLTRMNIIMVTTLLLFSVLLGLVSQSLVMGLTTAVLLTFFMWVSLWAPSRMLIDSELAEVVEPTHFNVNHQVKVRLTEFGKSIYEQHLEEERLLLNGTSSKNAEKYAEALRVIPDADGYYTFQMHVLMYIFGGQHMPGVATSVDIPFETEIILLPN